MITAGLTYIQYGAEHRRITLYGGAVPAPIGELMLALQNP